VTTAQLLSHSAGLSGWREPLAPEDLYDWERCTSLLAAQEPFWEPGTAPGYHGMTQGYLVGEVIRRITGLSFGKALQELVAGPLKADLYVGCDPNLDDRIAEMVLGDIAAPSAAPTELALNMLMNPGGDPLGVNTREWRAAEIPAANAHATARAIAETHRVLANGGSAAGVRLLSEAGCRNAFGLPTDGVDVVLGFPIRYGFGFGITGAELHAPNPNTLYWPGVGGALTIVDLDARTTFAYTPNRMCIGSLLDPRALKLAKAMW
jgi:CubicO group peptidase (beta-lactamase class C family)